MLLQSLLKYDTSACQRNDVVRDACQIRRQGVCGNREGAGRILALRLERRVLGLAAVLRATSAGPGRGQERDHVVVAGWNYQKAVFSAAPLDLPDRDLDAAAA